uniref:Uncharacterized protein n=1 Tax=Rhizophora mucronata TaxID=61149 RepID=A0A2P2PXN9_RHIMU
MTNSKPNQKHNGKTHRKKKIGEMATSICRFLAK